jgi:hypothetical protein
MATASDGGAKCYVYGASDDVAAVAVRRYHDD